MKVKRTNLAQVPDLANRYCDVTALKECTSISPKLSRGEKRQPEIRWALLPAAV